MGNPRSLQKAAPLKGARLCILKERPRHRKATLVGCDHPVSALTRRSTPLLTFAAKLPDAQVATLRAPHLSITTPIAVTIGQF